MGAQQSDLPNYRQYATDTSFYGNSYPRSKYLTDLDEFVCSYPASPSCLINILEFLDFNDEGNNRNLHIPDEDTKDNPLFKRIDPIEGFCIKTINSEGGLVYINICHCDDIECPSNALLDTLLNMTTDDLQTVDLPLSLGKPHREWDEGGGICLAFDVVLNTDFYEKQVVRYELLKAYVLVMVMRGLNDKYNLCLQMTIVAHVTEHKYWGTMPQHFIARKMSAFFEDQELARIFNAARTKRILRWAKKVTVKRLRGEPQKRCKMFKIRPIHPPNSRTTPCKECIRRKLKGPLSNYSLGVEIKENSREKSEKKEYKSEDKEMVENNKDKEIAGESEEEESEEEEDSVEEENESGEEDSVEEENESGEEDSVEEEKESGEEDSVEEEKESGEEELDEEEREDNCVDEELTEDTDENETEDSSEEEEIDSEEETPENESKERVDSVEKIANDSEEENEEKDSEEEDARKKSVEEKVEGDYAEENFQNNTKKEKIVKTSILEGKMEKDMKMKMPLPGANITPQSATPGPESMQADFPILRDVGLVSPNTLKCLDLKNGIFRIGLLLDGDHLPFPSALPPGGMQESVRLLNRIVPVANGIKVDVQLFELFEGDELAYVATLNLPANTRLEGLGVFASCDGIVLCDENGVRYCEIPLQCHIIPYKVKVTVNRLNVTISIPFTQQAPRYRVMNQEIPDILEYLGMG